MAVKEKISKILSLLNEGVYERENEIKLALLSSIAGESIFLLGPPGVAKSLVARRLKFAYKDAKVFEYLMSRFSTPDEIFGPVSISKLKDNDKYERVIDKYLPSSEVVFLDEIWKAGPSIQNALLTVINEKIFRNGDEEIKVPMKALISASNELPAKEQGLEALWDRFLVRLVVENITDLEKFNEMISKKLNAYEDNIEVDIKIKEDEYKEWSKKIDEIIVSENIFNVIHNIRNYIDEHNKKEEQIYVSDRRWRKIMRLLRTSAFLNERKEVDLMDCFLISHCIWNEESQIESTYSFVKDAIEKYGYTVDLDFKGIKEEIEEFKKDVDTYTHEVRSIKHTINKVYKYDNKKYLRILGLSGKFSYENNDLITEKDINAANKKTFIPTTRHRNDFGDKDTVYIKKGEGKHSLILSNDNYSNNQHELEIEVIDVEKNTVVTTKPHPNAEKGWDEYVDGYILRFSKWKEQIEEYRNKDLKHLCENLFVNPNLANIVKSHLAETLKEIEKIELEVKNVQHEYKKLDAVKYIPPGCLNDSANDEEKEPYIFYERKF